MYCIECIQICIQKYIFFHISVICFYYILLLRYLYNTGIYRYDHNFIFVYDCIFHFLKNFLSVYIFILRYIYLSLFITY